MGFHESCKLSTTAKIDDIKNRQYELLDRAEPIVWVLPDDITKLLKTK